MRNFSPQITEEGSILSETKELLWPVVEDPTSDQDHIALWARTTLNQMLKKTKRGPLSHEEEMWLDGMAKRTQNKNDTVLR